MRTLIFGKLPPSRMASRTPPCTSTPLLDTLKRAPQYDFEPFVDEIALQWFALFFTLSRNFCPSSKIITQGSREQVQAKTAADSLSLVWEMTLVIPCDECVVISCQTLPRFESLPLPVCRGRDHEAVLSRRRAVRRGISTGNTSVIPRIIILKII